MARGGHKRADSHPELLAAYKNFNFLEQTVCEEIYSKITFFFFTDQ
jgi:hypothetical protein